MKNCTIQIKLNIVSNNGFFLFQALDLWMAVCMLFVFAALAEFVIVKVLEIQYQAAKHEKLMKSELSNTV